MADTLKLYKIMGQNNTLVPQKNINMHQYAAENAIPHFHSIDKIGTQ